MSTTADEKRARASQAGNGASTKRASSPGNDGARTARPNTSEAWPALPFDEWQATYDTLHMWTQMAGKVKLELAPFVNEWWEVALHLSARGLTTQRIPYQHGAFEIEFDLISHNLYLRSSWDTTKALPLLSRTVADFYAEFMAALKAMGVGVAINTVPQEVQNPIPFEQDTQHKTYTPEHAHRFWQILTSVGNVFEQYRAHFAGKSSPVQFFWGSFDLSIARFNGKAATPPKTGGRIMRYGEDAQNIAAGFWPGGNGVSAPALYAYAYPEPSGYKSAKLRPAAAHYDTKLGEFLLSYDDVRNAAKPEQLILEFLESHYQAAAKLADWDTQAFKVHMPSGVPN